MRTKRLWWCPWDDVPMFALFQETLMMSLRWCPYVCTVPGDSDDVPEMMSLCLYCSRRLWWCPWDDDPVFVLFQETLMTFLRWSLSPTASRCCTYRVSLWWATLRRSRPAALRAARKQCREYLPSVLQPGLNPLPPPGGNPRSANDYNICTREAILKWGLQHKMAGEAVYVTAASSLARNLQVPGNRYRYKNSGGQFHHVLHEGAMTASWCQQNNTSK